MFNVMFTGSAVSSTTPIYGLYDSYTWYRNYFQVDALGERPRWYAEPDPDFEDDDDLDSLEVPNDTVEDDEGGD